MAREKEEARKASKPREARRIWKDKVVAAVGTSQGSSSASQVGKTLLGAKILCWNCNADRHWAYDCPNLGKRIQKLVKNASNKSATSEVRSRREGRTAAAEAEGVLPPAQM